MDNKLPNIPYNLPITLDLDDNLFGSPDFNVEQKEMFSTLLKSGDLGNRKHLQNLANLLKVDVKDILNWITTREQRAIELQNKEWDVQYIRENGFDTYFPTDEFLKENVFKGQTWFKGIRDYQVLDAYMLANSTNTLMTHKMRLGKTAITTLGMINNKKVNRALIIVPKSTLYEWQSTINNWTDNTWTAEIVSANSKEKDNVNTIEQWFNGEFEALVINIDHWYKFADKFAAYEEDIDLMVIDEAHFLTSRNKNANMFLSGVKSNKLLQYRKQNVKFCWLLTGTPTKNHEYEILSLYYFLSPNNRNEKTKVRKWNRDNFLQFFDRFCHIDSIPSKANNFKFEVSNRMDYEKLLKELNLNHRIHRNTTDEFPDTSEKVYENITMDMNAPQKRAYKSLKDMMKMIFLEIENPLARDTFLRQIAVDHRLIKRNIMKELDNLVAGNVDNDKLQYMTQLIRMLLKKEDTGNLEQNVEILKEKINEKYGFKQKGAKSEWLLTYLKEQKDYIKGNELSDNVNMEYARQEIEDKQVSKEEANAIEKKHIDKGRNPVVIFSQFKQYLYLLKDDIENNLKSLGFKIEMVTGDNSKEREDIRQRFQNGEIDILLIQTDTVKVGVSLFRSNNAIFVDRKYSNQDMKQALERINHPDSKDVKLTYFLMTNDTIDELVEEANRIKQENTEYVNDLVMSDITGSNVNKAKEVFEKYMNKIK